MAKAAGDKAFLDYIATLATPAHLAIGPGQAVFWSNDFRDGTSRNKALAENLAKDGNHKVLRGLEPVTDQMWQKDFTFNGQEVSLAAKTKASALLSEVYAHSVQDNVTIYANYTGTTSFFRQSELPILMGRRDITQVTFIDAKDVSYTYPKEEWYRWQRQQWVDGTIQKLNETAKAWDVQTKEWEAKGKTGDQPQPNSYAVNGYALEMAEAYRNVAEASNPPYIDSVQENRYIQQLQNALAAIENPALRGKIIANVRSNLKDHVALRLFEADLEARAPKAAAAPMPAPAKPIAVSISVNGKNILSSTSLGALLYNNIVINLRIFGASVKKSPEKPWQTMVSPSSKSMPRSEASHVATLEIRHAETKDTERRLS